MTTTLSHIDKLYHRYGDHAYVRHEKRGVVSVQEADSAAFLQRIITQDITKADQGGMLRGCLLTPQGKYLHDFYISPIFSPILGEDEIIGYRLECEGAERAADLAKRLSLYKLRADVEMSVSPDLCVLAYQNRRVIIWPQDQANDHINDQAISPAALQIPTAEWDMARIMDGVADGTRDAEIGGSTLAELNLDTVAVSYQKGCYVGQELVARMHNRNLGKKHLVGVKFHGDLQRFSDYKWGQELEGLGILRSHLRLNNRTLYALILMNREVESDYKAQQTQGLAIKYDDLEIYFLGL